MNFFGLRNTVIDTTDKGGAVVRRTQEIPDDFLTSLDDERAARKAARLSNEMVRIASIPVAKVHEWYVQGFDIYDPNVTAEEIIARLQRDDASRLIVYS